MSTTYTSHVSKYFFQLKCVLPLNVRSGQVCSRAGQGQQSDLDQAPQTGLSGTLQGGAAPQEEGGVQGEDDGRGSH